MTVPKGGRSRQLPMTQRLTASLKAARHLRSDRVWCFPDGSPITRDRVIKAVRGAQRVAGIEQGVHILRHTFCSHLEMKGDGARGLGTLLQHQESGERSHAAHRSGAGIEGVPASDGVRGLGTKSPDQNWIAGYGNRNRLTGLFKVVMARDFWRQDLFLSDLRCSTLHRNSPPSPGIFPRSC